MLAKIHHLRSVESERHADSSFEKILRDHLDQLLGSSLFDASARSRDFLSFVVEETLAGRGSTINQTAIAIGVFGRGTDFDPILDPIVRVQAGRLRRSLERFYLLKSGSPVRIELPKGGYTPSFVRDADDCSGLMAVESETDWPSVVVHEFESSPADAEACQNVAEEIGRELHRYGDIHVARRSDVAMVDVHNRPAVRFELHGRLHQIQGGYCTTVRLVDRKTGEQLWSEELLCGENEFSFRNLQDVSRVIAARVGSEHGIIIRTLSSEYRARSPDQAVGYSTLRRCYHYFFSFQVGEFIPTLEALANFVAQQPENALAWTHLARLYLANYSFELSDLHTPIERAIHCGYQALLLDPASPKTRCVLATALLVKGEIAAAQHELSQALKLNGQSLAYRETIGWLTALTGNWDQGMVLMRDAVSRNPFSLAHVNHGFWAHHLMLGNFESAYIAALAYRDPSFFWGELMKACSLGHLGRTSDARASVADLLRAKPQFAYRGSTLIGYYIKSDSLRQLIEEGLRKAGLVLNRQ
ncbi:MAG: hypothetical protein ACJ8MR_10545 [Povalibacter sp.]